MTPDNPLVKNCVIPAKAGIQMIKNSPRKWGNIIETHGDDLAVFASEMVKKQFESSGIKCNKLIAGSNYANHKHALRDFGVHVLLDTKNIIHRTSMFVMQNLRSQSRYRPGRL